MSATDAITRAAIASSGQTTAKKKEEAVMGKEDFLKLLVTQLKNQDPLNPDDPTEFTAQLAQFSSLEQLFTLNESVNNLVTSTNNSDRLSTLSTIGKEVAYTSSSFSFDGSPVEVGYQLDGPATEVTLELQLNGVTQASIKGTELAKGNHYIAWDGLLKNGSKAPSGNYKIVVSAKAGEGSSVAVNPLVKSEVTGVDLGSGGGGTLITKAGEIAFTSIIGVYDPRQKVTSTATAKTTSTETLANTAADTLATADTLAESAENLTNTVDNAIKVF